MKKYKKCPKCGSRKVLDVLSIAGGKVKCFCYKCGIVREDEPPLRPARPNKPINPIRR